MIYHAGFIKNVNGFDYSYNQIPDVVYIYTSFIHEDDSTDILKSLNDKIVMCVFDEILNILDDKTLKLKNHNLHKIKPKSLLDFIYQNKDKNQTMIILNLGSTVEITFKNIKTNVKYTFTVTNGMLIIVNDISNLYTISILNSSDNIDNIITYTLN